MSSASTIVYPMVPAPPSAPSRLLPCFESGWYSSKPHACCSYAAHDSANASLTAASLASSALFVGTSGRCRRRGSWNGTVGKRISRCTGSLLGALAFDMSRFAHGDDITHGRTRLQTGISTSGSRSATVSARIPSPMRPSP